MRTIIAGSRGISDYDAVATAMATFQKTPTEVVSGCARGVDQLGEEWARRHGIPIKYFSADWARHGKSAGPIRNRQMADYADALVAIWDSESRGTANMIEQATERGLLVHIYRARGKHFE